MWVCSNSLFLLQRSNGMRTLITHAIPIPSLFATADDAERSTAGLKAIEQRWRELGLAELAQAERTRE